MKLLAPVLSFTADEIWETLNPGSEANVFEQQWHELPPHGLDVSHIGIWQAIRYARFLAQKDIEKLREQGQVGSSLQAELKFYFAGAVYEALKRLNEDLKFVMITSAASVVEVASDADQKIVVSPSTHTKCERCWHYRADVGSNADHPHICGRCVSNLYGDGEPRQYA